MSVRLSVPYFFAIFRVFKLWILIEDYLRTNSAAWICDLFPRSSGIDLGIGPSHIRVISYISDKTLEFFNWYRRLTVNYKYFKDIFPIKCLKAPGSCSNPRIQLFPPVK
jgi:hypothetical protein